MILECRYSLSLSLSLSRSLSLSLSLPISFSRSLSLSLSPSLSLTYVPPMYFSFIVYCVHMLCHWETPDSYLMGVLVPTRNTYSIQALNCKVAQNKVRARITNFEKVIKLIISSQSYSCSFLLFQSVTL